MSEFNPYKILEVNSNASTEEIKKAYWKKAKEFHPDIYEGDTEHMFSINEAYEILSDEEKRNQFNLENEDGNFSESIGDLYNGPKLSEKYEENFKRYQKEWDKIDRLFDNFSNVAKKYKQKMLSNQNTTSLNIKFDQIDCGICIRNCPRNQNKEFQNVLDWHHEQFDENVASLLTLKNLTRVSYFDEAKEIKFNTFKDDLETQFSESYNLLKWLEKSFKPISTTQMDDIVFDELNPAYTTKYNYGKLFDVFRTTQSTYEKFFITDCDGKIMNPNFILKFIKKEDIPIYIDQKGNFKKVESTNCKRCEKTFGFFQKGNFCQRCSQKFCYNCLLLSKMQEYNINYLVYCCKDCFDFVKVLHSKLWIKKALEIESECCLAFSFESLSRIDNELYLRAGNEFQVNGKHKLALQCYYYGKLSQTQFIEYSRKLSELKQFSECILSMKYISKLFNVNFDSIGESNFLKSTEFSILCYVFHKNNLDYLFQKIIKFQDSERVNLLIQFICKKQKFVKLFPYLKKEVSLISKFVSIAKFNENELTQVINFLMSLKESKFKNVVMFFDAIKNQDEFLVKLIHKKKYPELSFIYHFIKKSSVFKWIDLFSELKSNQLCLNVFIFLKYHLNIDLNQLKLEFLKKQQYNQYMMLCHFDSLSKKTHFDIESIISLFDDHTGFVMSYFNSINKLDFLGNRLFDLKKYMFAIDCFIKNKSEPSFILQKAKETKDVNIIIYYYHQIVKNYPNNHHWRVILKNILRIKEMNEIQFSNTQCFKMILSFIKQTKIVDIDILIPLLTYASDESKSLILHAFNHDSNFQNHSIVLSIKSKLQKSQENQFRSSLLNAVETMNVKELVLLLLNVNMSTKKVIEEILIQKLGKFQLDSFPDQYKSILLLLKSSITSNINEKVGILCQCFFLFPEENIQKYISKVIENPKMRKSIFQGSFFKNDISIPKVNEYPNKLKITKDLKMIRGFEKGILKNSKTSLESGFLYIDFCMASRSSVSFVNNFLLSQIYFLTAMKESKSKNEIYALWKLIVDLAPEIISIAGSYLNPNLKGYYFENILNIILNAYTIIKPLTSTKPNNSTLIGSIYETIFDQILEEIVQLKRFFSFPSINKNYTTFDMVFLNLLSSEYLKTSLNFISEKSGDTDIPKELAEYYLFEGVWKGWNNDDFSILRKNSMISLLKNKKINIETIEDLMNWPLLERDLDGWLPPKVMNLNFPNKSFHKINGIELTNTNVNLLIEDTGTPLFDSNDISEIFQLGITSAAFTLDQPSELYDSHPFQEMKYSPSNISGTMYLGTLLHCDYLLKMMTTQTEISSRFPFEIKNSSDGFSQRIPRELHEKLILKNRSGKAHRFWIEIDKLDYQKIEKGDNTKIVFSDVKMKIKKHLLSINEKGEYVDAKIDSKDDSPEALFAKNFTENYDEIGKYFPELLRLKELAKISAVYVFLRSEHDMLEAKIKATQTTVQEYFDKLRKDGTYPLNTYSRVHDEVENALSKAISASGVPEYQFSYQQKETFRTQIRSDISNQLERADSQFLSSVSQQLENLSMISISTSDIKSCMKTGNSIHISNRMMMNQKKLITDILKFGISTESNDLYGVNSDPVCCWVPATFNQLDDFRVYGGVSMNLNRMAQNQFSRNHLRNNYKITTNTFKNGFLPQNSTQKMSFAKASAQFKQNCVDNKKLPSHIRGYLQNQYYQKGSWYKVNNPPGYQVGHRIPGLNNPNTFRWEFGKDNMHRGAKIFFESYHTSEFNEGEVVVFPQVAGASLPVIEKVLYGVAGHEIDMTQWFRSYFIQHEVNLKIEIHNMDFNSIYGDPKPYTPKKFKITYYYPTGSTLWMAPPLRITETGKEE
eukprot:gene10675-3296_t